MSTNRNKPADISTYKSLPAHIHPQFKSPRERDRIHRSCCPCSKFSLSTLYRMFCCGVFCLMTMSIALYYPEFINQNQTLSFHSDGNFKILQVADVHFGNGKTDKCKDLTENEERFPCSSLNSTSFIEEIYALEKPDLVVYTGDNIDKTASDAMTSMNKVFNLRNKGPWAAVLGNHDGESTLTRYQVMRYIMTLKNNMVNIGSYDVTGYGNYVIKLSNGISPIFNLFFLDSGSKSKNPLIPGYAKIDISQINWYKSESSSSNKLPAIAFFHIPLPEYGTCSLTDIKGTKKDTVGSPKLNSGLYSEMQSQGDVKMINVGHDHNNDFCGACYGIYLCYGGGVGYNTYGSPDLSKRVRLIEIGEFGKTITTWKRLHDGKNTKIDEQKIM